MNTKLLLVPAAVISFATLPSCTTGGGLDPVAINSLARIYDEHEARRLEEKRMLNEQFMAIQQAKQAAGATAPVDPLAPVSYPVAY